VIYIYIYIDDLSSECYFIAVLAEKKLKD
jgi:hypothetical protein